MNTNKPRKTVLITGSSTGIGRETAKLFQAKGWNVAATMRTPSKEKFFNTMENVLLLELDVTKPETIQPAIEATIKKFGGIDVIVNNAGYGATGPFEQTAEDHIQKQFDTNVFGPMRIIQAILPHLREKKSGTIVNISSMGGRITFPLYSLYHGTKWALEGFTEGLQYELEEFNIQLRLVEPGAIRTDFYTRSADKINDENLGVYKDFHDRTMPQMMAAGEKGLIPDKVAQTVYKAATTWRKKLRWQAGPQSKFLLFLRRVLPERFFYFLVKAATVNPPKGGHTGIEPTVKHEESPKESTPPDEQNPQS